MIYGVSKIAWVVLSVPKSIPKYLAPSLRRSNIIGIGQILEAFGDFPKTLLK